MLKSLAQLLGQIEHELDYKNKETCFDEKYRIILRHLYDAVLQVITYLVVKKSR